MSHITNCRVVRRIARSSLSYRPIKLKGPNLIVVKNELSMPQETVADNEPKGMRERDGLGLDRRISKSGPEKSPLPGAGVELTRRRSG
jgi:hypothetical protein